MKALVVTPYYYPKIGGLENYARQLNIALQSNYNWEIVIASSNSSFRSQISEVDGQRIYRLGTWFKLSNTPFSLIWPFKLKQIIRTEHPDIILAHAPVPSLADVAARVKGETPFILVYHAATLLKQDSLLFNIVASCYNFFGRGTFKRADNIWAVSDFVRQQLPEQFRAKTQVLPNAVWASEIKSRKQPSKKHFVFIASLNRSHAWKGLANILKAIAIYKEKYGEEIELTVIGDGNAKQNYIDQTLELGIDSNVHFVGALTGQDKIHKLRQALAVLIYPTTSNDAFPTVMLEAWSQQVPVIAAAIGPIPSLIDNAQDSYLCEARNPDSLAATIYSFSQLSATGREIVALRASQKVEKNYTWEKQAMKANQYAGVLV